MGKKRGKMEEEKRNKMGFERNKKDKEQKKKARKTNTWEKER